jgi:hypothetical protein
MTTTAKAEKPKNAVKPKNSKRGGIQITGDGKFPLVPIDKIEIAERPAPGEEHLKLYYNPRDLESFTPESMTQLRSSIRTDGLQSPPLVRAFTENGVVVKIELIAGERRLRSVLHIIEHDLPCFDEDQKRPQKYKTGQVVVCKGHFGQVVSQDANDVTVQILDDANVLTEEERVFAKEDVYPTVAGSKFYAAIPCRVAYDIDDKRALRLAFSENDKHKSLSTKEEIALVERLKLRGLKVAEISEMLDANETWVSQTANFRTDLPPAALEKLLDGSMKRHVAVNIMGYKPADRDKAFAMAVEVEAEETKKKIEDADDEMAKAQDDEILALADKKKAAKAGDTKGANKAARVAASAATKAKKAEEKKKRAEEEKGQIRTGHIQKGAAKAGLSPKKAKILPKEEIEEYYITGMEDHLDGESVDPICGEEIPADLAAIVRATAAAILNGNRDPLSVIRQYKIEQEEWTVKKAKSDPRDRDDEDDDDYDDEDDEDFDGPSDEELTGLDDDEFDDDGELGDDDLAVVRGRGRGVDDDEDY